MTRTAPSAKLHATLSEETLSTAYPRPLLRREAAWQSLDGTWQFAFGKTNDRPDEISFADTIRVPFSPETEASGIANTNMFDTVWYRRDFQNPPLNEHERLLLHFEAIDDIAEVWINDQRAGQISGPSRQTLDITDLLIDGTQTITVRAFDDPHDLTKPRGKQDWQPQPHAIWYPRTTGIWQTVWLERVPTQRIKTLNWTPNVSAWQLGLDIEITGELAGLTLEVDLSFNGRRLAEDRYALTTANLQRTIRLPDPGIDDARNDLLWTPERPNLIDAELRLVDAAGTVIDRVGSYTAMRSIETRDGRFLLNGRPLFLRFVLAQGYWAESGLTPPDDDALRRDVELVKALGFNGVRMHQKVEAERFLYWADHLGLLVWGEMSSSYSYTPEGWLRVQEQWSQRVLRDRSHPSVIAWVPVNESWGLPDLETSAPQRAAMSSIYHLTKALDPTRPVIGNDGWELGETDVVAIHDYEGDPERIRDRYDERRRDWDTILRDERPGQRKLLLEGYPFRGQPLMLGEFGGVSLDTGATADGWGYTATNTPEQLGRRYAALITAVNGIERLAGFCYTQFTDTYQEINGLVTMQRVPKLPLARLRAATLGQAESQTSIDPDSSAASDGGSTCAPHA